MHKTITVKTIVLSILLLCGGIESDCFGLTFRSDKIEALAKAAAVDLSGRDSSFSTTWNGREITVRIADGEVEHIGYRLFPNGLRGVAVNEGIADFVERYWMELSMPADRQKTVSQQMLEDKFAFVAGGLDLIDRIQKNHDCDFSCNVSETLVLMAWGDKFHPFCKIQFPVNHELILGRTMRENDRRLPAEILRTSTDQRHGFVDSPHFMSDTDTLSSIYICKSGIYLDCELRSDRYFKNEQNIPVFDPEFPAESVSNLFTDYDIEASKNIALAISQQIYGLNEQRIDTTIGQFVAYCMQNGCTPYVGIIDLDCNGRADLLVIMRNWEIGYNHVLRVALPVESISTGCGKATARLNAFVPSSNVKNLFNDEKQN